MSRHALKRCQNVQTRVCEVSAGRESEENVCGSGHTRVSSVPSSIAFLPHQGCMCHTSQLRRSPETELEPVPWFQGSFFSPWSAWVSKHRDWPAFQDKNLVRGYEDGSLGTVFVEEA